jgi:hypothetical protein
VFRMLDKKRSFRDLDIKSTRWVIPHNLGLIVKSVIVVIS